jgi:hypothetical protein
MFEALLALVLGLRKLLGTQGANYYDYGVVFGKNNSMHLARLQNESPSPLNPTGNSLYSAWEAPGHHLKTTESLPSRGRAPTGHRNWSASGVAHSQP